MRGWHNMIAVLVLVLNGSFFCRTCMFVVAIVILCAVCTKEYVIHSVYYHVRMYGIYVCICRKYQLFGILLVKKCLET